MSDFDDLPPPRRKKPVPLILWVMLGFVVMLGFMLALKALNPQELGKTPPIPDVVVPINPKPVSLPDVKPGS